MIRRTVATKQESFIVGKATNPLLKPCANFDIYAFMRKATRKDCARCLQDGVVAKG